MFSFPFDGDKVLSIETRHLQFGMHIDHKLSTSSVPKTWVRWA